MPTLYSIQYLRALAALAVVVFHAGERSGAHFQIGAAGVDVFFVVSGFIMVAISDNRPTTPGGFLWNRLLRIAPSYWLATLAMIIGAVIGLFPNLKLEFGHTLASFLFFPMPSPSTGDLWPVLVQGWTLNYEIFFYLVFALTLLAPSRLRLPLLAAIFGLLVVAGGTMLQPQDRILAFYMAPVILEFVAGAALAKAWRNGYLPPAPVGMVMVVIGLAGFAAIQILKLDFDALTCGPLALILVTGALSVETRGKLPNMPALAYLGDASYSIYLWHTFAVSVVVKVGMSLHLPAAATLGLAVCAGTVIGIIAYEGVERPIQALIKGKRTALWRLPSRRLAR